ncbi:MAG: M1 family aminopeptidase [Hyalangium sp.]|uniref:M1 family aminopeptidase n=1 Tax=Hyalangium sp. TaxID=2028555 RepID=UPI00389A9C00
MTHEHTRAPSYLACLAWDTLRAMRNLLRLVALASIALLSACGARQSLPAAPPASTPVPQPTAAEEARPDGSRTFRFARTQPLPSYLIAFGVGPFDFLPAADAGQKKVKTRIITPRGRAVEGTYAAEVTPQILAALESYFGIPYAYEKLDVLAQPVLSGAMEHPGLVTFNPRSLLSKPEEDTLQRQRRFAQTQVHELAHQWRLLRRGPAPAGGWLLHRAQRACAGRTPGAGPGVGARGSVHRAEGGAGRQHPVLPRPALHAAPATDAHHALVQWSLAHQTRTRFSGAR